MNVLFLLIPITFCLGLAGLAAFLWSMRTGQYEDLSGAAERVLLEEGDRPARPGARAREPSSHRSTKTSEEPTWSRT